MLVWHRKLWLIDHGAALYFHHTWNNALERSRDPFPMIKDHVLLQFASSLPEADSRMTGLITADIIHSIVRLIPDAWLVGGLSFRRERTQHRGAYAQYLLSRLERPHAFLEEAIRARALHV